MIRLSRKARTQIASLARFYDGRDRAEAVINLRRCIANAATRIETRRGPFFTAPRPYPQLARPGWRWVKQGTYWIAYAIDTQGPVIQVVFHDAADMPGRI